MQKHVFHSSQNDFAAAALYRTACKTVVHWPEWKRQLLVAAETALPGAVWGAGGMSPTFWDSDPIAQNLDFAFRMVCFDF